MSTTNLQSPTEPKFGFLAATELSLPKNETALREVQNLQKYGKWLDLNDTELDCLNKLVVISEEKAKIKNELIKNSSSSLENGLADLSTEERAKIINNELLKSSNSSVKEVLRNLSNQERTATIDLNRARDGIEIFVKTLTERNPFDNGSSMHSHPKPPMASGEIMSILDLRIIINEDLKIRERDKLQTVFRAINKYDCVDTEVANAKTILESYQKNVVPHLIKKLALNNSLAESIQSLNIGDTSQAISSSRNALTDLRSSAELSLDDDTRLFLRACGNQEMFCDSIGIKIPANPAVLSNGYLKYATSLSNLSESNSSSPYFRIQKEMWDKEIPWGHENKLHMEADMSLAHVLYASLKRFHYLGEAYKSKLDEIEKSPSITKEEDRKEASRTLWQLYRQSEFLIGQEVEDRLVGEIKAKAFNHDDLKELGILAILEQSAAKEEFKKYQNFLGTGDRADNIAHLPSSYRVASAVSRVLEENGVPLNDKDKAFIQDLENNPNKMAQYLAEAELKSTKLFDFHQRITQECEPYGAILSLINLVPEVGPNSAYSRTKDFSSTNSARDESLNLLYGVCLRLSQLSERMNCGPGQIDELLKEFTSNNREAKNYQELLDYTEEFKSRLTSR